MASDLCGWTRGFVYRRAIAALLAVLGFCFAVHGWASDGEARHAGRTCLIVDTDVATDDFRAFAVLFPQRGLRAVVVTEGIASVPRASSAIALFLASGQSLAPVIPGLASSSPPAYEWLPAARAAAERINGLLAQSVASAASPNKLKRSLSAALRGCRRVDVLVLGPWSSFIEYAPMLRPLIRRVIASGRPLAENNPDNFNCVYDQPACEQADALLRQIPESVWVDLPADGASYPPTQEMIDQLALAGMPGLLRAALNADPSQWLGTRLWDDTAALYMLAPEHFRSNGAHFEPFIDEQTLRRELIRAMNAAPRH
jgi:inosine-uridine nucleoside N-ribohydrolase